MGLSSKNLVVPVGIEPTLGPNLGHTGYKSVDASNYITGLNFGGTRVN